MRSRTGLRAAIVALLASVLLAACGTGNDVAAPSPKAEKPTPLETLTLVSAKTSAAKTAKLAINVNTSLASGQSQTVSARGAADFSARKIRMTMRASGQTVQVVMIGTTMYMRLPGQEPQPGKPWLKLDLAALGKASGTNLNSLTQGAGSDPTQALALLKGVSSNIREVGTEQVRGADTTHYKVTLDLRKAANQQSQAARKQVARFLEQSQVRSVPADVWVDGGGRLRRMRYAMKLKPSGTTGTVTVRTSMEVFDFGTAVTVARPPASQVVDFADLLQGGATG
jgi:hypothetical protein